MKYVVITPIRNEVESLQRTIDSMIRQTTLPAEWLIVDDGSTDGTTELAIAAASQNPWIRLIQRRDRGFRKSGVGVVEAFYDGFNQLETPDWEVIVKLDGDLEFQPDFFQTALSALKSDEKLGIVGGDVYHFEGSQLVIESKTDPAIHVRGASKIYIRACWEAIGGLFCVTGWDTLDEIKAIMLGWRTSRIPELRILHLKPTGAADGTWRNAFKNGRGSFISGYHPLFLIARCLRRIFGRPLLVEPLGLFAGYFSSYFFDVQRVNDAELVAYIQTQQIRRLVGKPSIWR